MKEKDVILGEVNILLTIVVACYNEEDALPYFFEEVRKVADAMSDKYNLAFEFLFINDGSKDKTLDLLRSYSSVDK